MTDPKNDNLTDTLNWDTVFAIPVTKVNEAIVGSKSSPKNFSYTGGKNDVIQGDFGDWQIVRGGDGSLIYLSLPVSNVTGSTEMGSFAWSQGSVVVEVRLAYLPHTDGEKLGKNADGSKTYALKVKTSSNDPSNPVVSLKTTQFTVEPNGSAVVEMGPDYVKAVIPALIVAWLNENLQDFNHVFATVNLNEYIDKDATWKWTKPTYIDYAYADGSTLETSVLGVLCMTGGRTGSVNQIQAIDPFAIPGGSIAGYLVAEQRLLEDLMLPTLPLKWKKAVVSNFEVVNNADTETGAYQYVLKLKDGVSIELEPVEHDGNSYTPYLKTMKIALEDNEIIFETYTETDVGMGVTAYCDTTHWYTIELGRNQFGQTLFYKATKEPVVSQGTKETLGSEIEKWADIIVGVLATVVLGVVTDGVGFAVGAVVIGLLTGVAVNAPGIVESLNQDTSPNLDLLVSNSTNPIQWNSSGVFNLDFAGLNGPLQLGGTPNFST